MKIEPGSLSDALGPAIGIGDFFDNPLFAYDVNNEKEYRKMLRDEFIPYFKSNYSDEEQEKILLAIRVALSDSNFNGFESVFSGCLANDIAPKNRRDFFLWFWEELRPGGEYFLSNWRDYEWGIIF